MKTPGFPSFVFASTATRQYEAKPEDDDGLHMICLPAHINPWQLATS